MIDCNVSAPGVVPEVSAPEDNSKYERLFVPTDKHSSSTILRSDLETGGSADALNFIKQFRNPVSDTANLHRLELTDDGQAGTISGARGTGQSEAEGLRRAVRNADERLEAHPDIDRLIWRATEHLRQTGQQFRMGQSFYEGQMALLPQADLEKVNKFSDEKQLSDFLQEHHPKAYLALKYQQDARADVDSADLALQLLTDFARDPITQRMGLARELSSGSGTDNNEEVRQLLLDVISRDFNDALNMGKSKLGGEVRSLAARSGCDSDPKFLEMLRRAGLNADEYFGRASEKDRSQGKPVAEAGGDPESALRAKEQSDFNKQMVEKMADSIHRTFAEGAIDKYFQTLLNDARERCGPDGEDLFVRRINGRLAEADSPYRIMPHLIAGEEREYRLVDTDNGGKFVDTTGKFKIERSFESTGSQSQSFHPDLTGGS